jgi:hypothetical protein
LFSSFDHLSPSASGGAAPPSGLLGTKREDRAPVWRPNSSGCRPLLSLPSGGGRSSSSSRAPTAPATELKLVRASQLVGFATTEELARAEAVISLSVRLLHRRVPPPPLRIPLHMSCRGDIVLLPARRVGLTFSSTMRFELCPAGYRQGPRAVGLHLAPCGIFAQARWRQEVRSRSQGSGFAPLVSSRRREE